MTAEAFLAAFLGCLFAMVFMLVIGMQIASYVVIRWAKKHMPDIIAKTLHGATGTHHGATAAAGLAEFEELMKVMAKAPPGAIPHLPIIVCRCGARVDVPLDVELPPVLEAAGWVFDLRFDGWACPACASTKPEAA